MRICTLLSLLVAGVFSALAQVSWSPPVPITSGNYDNVHPMVADGEGWLASIEELLAFSRNGKDICVLRTTNNGTVWQTEPYQVTTDSADNDFPSLVHTSGYQPLTDTVMLVWQARKNSDLDIYYSMYNQPQWSVPQPVTADTADDIRPHVGFSAGRYHVTWERSGAIMFSQFDGISWSPAQLVSSVGDTLNHSPQVFGYYISGSNRPVVVWEKKRGADTTCVLMYAYRSGTTWTVPDTLTATGDNRRPKFFKYIRDYGLTSLQWERREQTGPVCYTGNISTSGGRVVLGSVEPLFFPSESRNASVNGFMIITLREAMQFAWYAVAACESAAGPIDSIGVSVWANPLEKLGAPAALSNRNPDVTQGTGTTPGFSVRFWVVWEALVAAKWQLYGSNIVLHIDDVDESGLFPRRVEMQQNFPNPFNPKTTIKYKLPGTSMVRLSIHDVLGREVSVLVNERSEAGVHEVRFDGAGLASGVYFYRLNADGFVVTRKLVLLR